MPPGNSASSHSNGGSHGSGQHAGVGVSVPVLRFGPTATITAPDITAAGATAQTITVSYADLLGVNAGSINTSNISVSGPHGALAVTSATAGSGSGTTLTATYTVAAPHGTWSAADDGSYTISLKANSVTDAADLPAAGASGSFNVRVPQPTVSAALADRTFAGGQPVDTTFVTAAMLSENDGSVVVVGHDGSLSDSTSRGVIERLNPDGSIDTSFGNRGQILTSSGTNEAYYAAVQEDATHFIVAGTSNGDFVLRRYDVNGTLDRSFGTSGVVTTDFGTASDAAEGLAMAPGGMIVAAGDSGGNFAFARYLPSGQLDSNFAQGGRQLFGVAAAVHGLGNIVVQSTGDVVAVGCEGANVIIVRLTASGEADGAFGKGGLITVPGIVDRTDLGAPDTSEGLALQGDKILVGNRTSDGHFGVVRLSSAGAVDPTFGVNGLATANFGGDDDVDALVMQPGGEILAIGTTAQGTTAQTAVAAFDSNGQLLSTFGNSGLLTLSSGVGGATISASTVSSASTKKMSPGSLHVGDIVLRAFGTATADGRLVISTTNVAPPATSSASPSGGGVSALRRLIVPGAMLSALSDPGQLLGSFGLVNGKQTRFTMTDADGTHITLSLTGGSGLVYQVGNGIALAMNDGGRGMALTVAGHGGDGRVSLQDVQASGTLKSINARNSDLAGTLHVTGSIGHLALGDIAGNVFAGASIASATAGKLNGNLYAAGALGRVKLGDVSGTIASGAGSIGLIAAASLSNARILSGANLGSDGAVGGSGADQDVFGPGSIGAIRIAGGITASFIGAGVIPTGQTFGGSQDTLAGTAAGDIIRSLTALAADDASRFEAGGFGHVRVGGATSIQDDPRFRIL